MQIPVMEKWEDSVRQRYNPERKKDEFRRHDEKAAPVVLEFYRQNHALQTLDFVRAKKKQYYGLNQRTMGIWEAARRDGRPRWFIMSGFLHDLGKILCLYGEPQWAVVGDTFVTGCKFSDRIVYPEFFAANPDSASLLTRLKTGSTNPAADSITSMFLGDTTSTFIM